MMRALRALAAALALLTVVVVPPSLLIGWGRLDVLSAIDLTRIWAVRDDGSLLLGVLTVVGWVAWGLFAASVLIEVVGTVRGRPVPDLVGLGLPRAVAGLLLATVVAVLVTGGPRAGSAWLDPVTSSSSAFVATILAPPPVLEVGQQVAAAELRPGSTLHVVQTQDDVWSLARAYYGDGGDWRRIVAANPTVLSSALTPLEVGMRLVIPGAEAVVAAGGGSAGGVASSVVAPDAERDVVVREGDSLWRIAETNLGDPYRWHEIYDLNRDQISNPDEIDVGWRLRLPAEVPATAPSAPGVAENPAQVLAEMPGSVPSLPEVAPGVGQSPEGPGVGLSLPKVAPAVDEPSSPEGRGATEPGDLPVRAGRAAGGIPAAGSNIPATRHDTARHDATNLAADPALAIVGGLSVLTLTALVALIGRRRAAQLQARPLGRRILHPDPDLQRFETAMGRLATAPALAQVETVFHGLAVPDSAPIARFARSDPGEASRAPAVVAIGRDADGAPVLLDLEEVRNLEVISHDPVLGVAGLAGLALGLVSAPWSAGTTVVCAGKPLAGLSGAGVEGLAYQPDVATAVRNVEELAARQREALAANHRSVGAARADDDARDSWLPTVYVFTERPTDEQVRRLRSCLDDVPAVAVAAAWPGHPLATELDDPEGRSRFVIESLDSALLSGHSSSFVPSLAHRRSLRSVSALLAVTGSWDTTPAPWFSEPGGATVTALHPHPPSTRETSAVGYTSPGVTDYVHPTLILLGPIELQGAAGPPPPRAERQCIEYCAWLLEHPGTTATAMANGLVVAEGTRRSNMSRLRGWLGADIAGQPYLPEAYSGRINLDPAVSSDWHRLQIVVSPGIDVVSRDTLEAALRMVRGAPLADAAPGQWHWAEELRTDMASLVRDIGVVLAESAVKSGDLDLARWAASRALTANPEDELLLCARIRTENRAGNRGEVERLAFRLTRHARLLGIDLTDETVRLLQEVIEGRPRARA